MLRISIATGDGGIDNEITLLTKAMEKISKAANGSSFIVLLHKKIRFHKANVDVLLIKLSINLVSFLCAQLIEREICLVVLIKFFILLHLWDGLEKLS